MAKRSVYCFLALIFMLVCSTMSVSANQAGWDIPFRIAGGWILAEGRIGEMEGLTFQIDIGSTCSAQFLSNHARGHDAPITTCRVGRASSPCTSKSVLLLGYQAYPSRPDGDDQCFQVMRRLSKSR